MTPKTAWGRLIRHASEDVRTLGNRDAGKETYYLADNNHQTIAAVCKFAQLARSCGYRLQLAGQGEVLDLSTPDR